MKLLTPIPHACHHCGLPLPESLFLVCGYCCKNKPWIDHTIAPYPFEEPLRTLLHDFKYHEELYLSSFLATLIVDNLPTEALQTQCLLPVPLHPKRLRHRGFNQAAELVKYLGKTLKIPYHLSLCKKITNTPSQASLSANQRRNNLRKAFNTKSTSYQHVTLVDDLLTTGSTVNELARLLKQQGVRQVDVWCCARAI
jgi:ComF family protein